MQSQERAPFDRPSETAVRAKRPVRRIGLGERLGRLAAGIGAILLSGAVQPAMADAISPGSSSPNPFVASPNGFPSSGLMESQLSGSSTFTNGSSADDPNYSGPKGSSSLSQSTSLGENGQLRVTGSADPSSPSFGTEYNYRTLGGLVREAQLGNFANDTQNVVTAGGTFAFFERDGLGLAGRALGSYVNDQFYDNGLSFSGDVFGGGRINGAYGEHWVKGGFFYDWQNQLSKYGPELGMLLFANEPHPATVDFALGFGNGTEGYDVARNRFFSAADRDIQTRLGMFVTPRCQLGVSMTVWDWDRDYSTILSAGAFTNLFFGPIRLGLDLSGGQDGMRGYATVAYVFGAPAIKMEPGVGPRIDGQAWLFQPVLRDVSIKTGQRKNNQNIPGAIGNITVTGGILSVSGDGVLNPGDSAQLILFAGNGTNRVALNVKLGHSVSGDGTAHAAVGAPTPTNFNDVLPGQTVQTSGSGNVTITVPPTANLGETINVYETVESDGVSRQVRITFRVGDVNGQVFNAVMNP